MSKTRRHLDNPIAVAMKKRYGKTSSVHADKRAPRGGQRNKMREYLDEYEATAVDEQQAEMNYFMSPDFEY